MLRCVYMTLGVVLVAAASVVAQDPADIDHSQVADASTSLAHLSDLLAFKGRPHNMDAARPVTVLINHGYMVGFSEVRRQPVWAAYRVSATGRDTQFARPHFFYDDPRLPKTARIGPDTFGQGYDRGHLVPNAAISHQYGKLAQLETFFMSNICPQKAAFNQGLWAKLEEAILNDYAPAWEHIWVLSGPIFADQPEMLTKKRPGNLEVPIPSHFFLILVDAFGRQNRATDVLGLKFSQDTPRRARLSTSFIESIDELERLTKLNFFPQFSARLQTTHEKEKAPDIWTVDEEEE